MTNPDWQEIEHAMGIALDLPEEEQAAWLGQQRPEVRAEVESLLAAHRRSSSFLEGGPETRDAGRSLASRHIGPYRLLEEIGRGGMGTVYRAERNDGRFQKQVAVKVMAAAVDSSEMLRRFSGEQRILATLEHPNITRMLDAGVSQDGLPYIVMEQVDGVPINQHWRARALPLNERLRLFRQVCSAAQYAHQRLVVHRDLKPANILVTEEGVPKLLDFGIAKPLGVWPDASSGGTRTTLNPMTPDYASPEQMRGGSITTATDIYSLGVILYELLTGERPYRVTGKTMEEAIRIVSETEPPKPNAAARIPADLHAIVAKAMRKEPQERYASSEELSTDVGRYLSGLPVWAHRGSFRYLTRKFVARHKFSVVAAMLMVLLAAGGSAAITRQARIAERERARAQARFDDVHQLANFVLFDLYNDIISLPGAIPVRKRLVTGALQYLDSLSRESAGDVTLQMELAAGYTRIGDVQGGLGKPNLGDTGGALASYGKAERILRLVLARDESRLDARRNLARVYLNVSEVHQFSRNDAEVLANARQAEALVQGVAPAPGDEETLSLLADVHFRLAVGLTGSDPKKSLDHYLKTLEIFQALLAAHPGKPSLSARVATVHRQLASHMAATGDAAKALDHRQKALELDERRLAANPADPWAKIDLSADFVSIGAAHFNQGNLEVALANYRRALDIRRALAEADPRDARLRRQLATTYLSIGETLARMGDPSAPLESYRRAAQIGSPLAEGNPADSYMRALLIRAYAGEASAEAELAHRSGNTPAGQERRRRSCSLYQLATESYRALKQNGGVWGDDIDAGERAAREAARCDAGRK
ncbi:MAG: serine/threonine-protein kinase [Acidobacteriia bacterium]|nr:serine/threonine-protein kinase [Terriglobia bacterium]